MAERVIETSLEKQLRDSYIDYAMSVIIQRALPEVRDGLKPVHRRILYAMYELGVFHNKPYRKSAKITGEVTANFHPHGTASVYEAMVRLAQDFNMHYLLIDGQGNFGSIDGDPPAAERYTEARLTEVAEELLKDIDKQTVNFVPNYDNTRKEPQVLPGLFPNLLVNGSSGIAVGMATSIPSHNLSEVVDAIIKLIDEPQTPIEDLMSILKGPDFPTGGVVINKSEILSIYKSGKGQLIIRGKVKIEDSKRIIIYELPYQVNKSNLLVRIAELMKLSKLTGITEIRDETNREGMRIVIELREPADSQIILNQLYKYTQLQITYPVIMLVLVDNQPKILNIKEIINLYIEHRKEIIKKRTEFALNTARRKYEISSGIKVAILNIQKTIDIIKKSKDTNTAKDRLKQELFLTDLQAKAILEMQLQKLTKLEIKKLDEQLSHLKEEIKDYEWILREERKVYSILKEELQTLKKKYAKPRKTLLLDESIDFTTDKLIPKEDIFVFLSDTLRIKRLPYDTFIKLIKTNQKIRCDETIRNIIRCNTHDILFFFGQDGKVYQVPAKDIPEVKSSKGYLPQGERLLSSLVKLKNTNIITGINSTNIDELLFITKFGYVKRIKLQEIKKIKAGTSCISLNKGDSLKQVIPLTNDDINTKDCMLLTKAGLSIRFRVNEVSLLSRNAKGVLGIRLKRKETSSEYQDIVQSASLVDNKNSAFNHSYVVTTYKNGFIKKTKLEEYRTQNRAGKGILAGKLTKKNLAFVNINFTNKEKDYLLVFTEEGNVYVYQVKDIPLLSRVSAGVSLLKERIVNSWIISSNEKEI